MDDARVSTIKYGVIKQFHHYKMYTQNEHNKWLKYPWAKTAPEPEPSQADRIKQES